MIPSLSKFLLITAPALFLATDAAVANHDVTRITHPNGAPTFMPNVASRCGTTKLCANQREVITENAARNEVRIQRIQMGRGKYIQIRNARS